MTTIEDSRTDWTPELKEAISRCGKTRAEVAAVLFVSLHTVNAWLKPATAKSARPVPQWAPVMLRLRTRPQTPKN